MLCCRSTKIVHLRHLDIHVHINKYKNFPTNTNLIVHMDIQMNVHIKMASRRYGRAQSRNVFYSRFFIKFCLPKKVVFHQKSSFIKGCLPSKVVFHQRLPSIISRLPSKVVFHQRSSSIIDRLPSKFVFH